jgi:stage IV sporulation protein FB
MMEETVQVNHDDGFPPKPELQNNESMLPKLLFSLALFVLAYYVFFDKDLMKMVILVAVLLIHEMGHFLAMKYFRYTEVKMFFIPLLGALVTGEKHEVSQRQRAIILLAGPVPGIVIGAVIYYFGIQTGNRELLSTASIFIFLNAANLLPLTPLDGGKLIETLFFNNQVFVSNMFTAVSAAIITVIAIKYEMYTLLLLPFFMLSGIRQQYAVKKVKDNLTTRGLDYNKSFDALTNREYWLIREQVVNDLQGFNTVDGSVYEVSPRERQVIQQIRSLADRHPTKDLGVGGIILFALIWFIFLGVPAAGIAYTFYSRM